ncbi:MAG: pyridoxamine 5'-phosphate oxidase [Proteobacteria bacterium]|nr:pyridoxamine 5'-phosphate oxidase [Pseudomonadota bacterium]MBS0464363.1 pyridoxamine 5'-phosphate oxidase [Pseudomonadota bacterium]
MPTLLHEALATFTDLLAAAQASGDPEPTAMTLATATRHGAPSARTVLLKSFDERGFVFYTHSTSAKGRELHDNPRAALLFHWKHLPQPVQVRIEGMVVAVDAAQADAYFASRPRMSQIGAWASLQSQTLDARETFEAAIARYESEFAGRDVPRPSGWTGYRVVPDGIEFWYAGDFRLHDRRRYDLRAGAWEKRMLYP